MRISRPVTVYTPSSERGLANAIVAGISARAHFGSQTLDRHLLAHHSSDRGTALVLLPLEGARWKDTELSALKGAIMVGSLSSSTSMIRGLAAGAHAAINSRLPFQSLLDEVHAALCVDANQPLPDKTFLAQRIRIRAEESERIATLTDREFEILGSLYNGWNVDAIARTAHIAPTTVRAHIRSILHKLEVHSQLEACALLHRSGHDARAIPLELRIGRY
ncbi:LuxR C-terminal-related transcriptional regulator [Rhodococcus sp. G-MC3]|uniref:helix-turn-helix transcriptional regulator n=1 Tax=Rhodococcus sp. G-MC3 TaxID=3046209 RepID=UPI0024BB72C2|nr:LuxR C-terminal-related transcriptional regulator [Rhodococcus sp. G-MC3]MDJ0396704.1 LuxR C-terminal-related transcriptional regulator [Rhodococcus sp. G-MC3]